MSTTINPSSSLILLGSQENVFLIDPKTSSVLQQFKHTSQGTTHFCSSSDVGYVMLCSQDKNQVQAFDFKGQELWKQNLATQSQLIGLFDHDDVILGFYKNKEVKVWSQIWEKTIGLEMMGDLYLVQKNERLVSVVEAITHQILIFYIEDLVLGINSRGQIGQSQVQPIKTLSVGSQINSINLGDINLLYVITKDKQYISWKLNNEDIKPINKGTLESEPLCVEQDGINQYIYIGCSNKTIYQIKVSENTQNQNTILDENQGGQVDFRIEKDYTRKRMLNGHLSEVVALKYYVEEGNGILLSGGADGQLFFWSIFDPKNDSALPQVVKKIITLTNKRISEIQFCPRPFEYRFESQSSALFKIKRTVNIKPLKKGNVQSKSLHLNLSQSKSMVKSLKNDLKSIQLINYQLLNQQNKPDIDQQIQELIKENRQLKINNIQLFQHMHTKL